MGTQLEHGVGRTESTTTTSRPLTPAARGVCVAAAVAYGIAIWSSAADVDGVRHWVLLDDAMISMTYARTFAEGHGLVWFPGADHVEGYTNFAWVLWMAVVHLLRLPTRLTPLVVMATSAGLLVATATVAWRLTLRLVDDHRVAMVALVLVLACYPLVFWSLLGMEVGLLALLALAACLLADQVRLDPRPVRVTGLCGVLALGVLTRTDFVLVAGAVVLWLALHAGVRRAAPIAGAVALTLVAHTAFRLAYYGYPLPNTYYLKATGLPLTERLRDGLEVLRYALPNLFVTGLLAGVGVVALRRHAVARLLASVVALQVAYSVYVGGDAWEWYALPNRYITVGLPAALVLAAVAVHTIASRVRVPGVAVAATAGLLVLGSLLTPGVSPGIRVSGIQAEQVRYGRELARTLPAGTSITVTWAGTIPYVSRLPAVDLLGKMDPVVAHGPVHPAGRRNPPGHRKWDYDRSIGDLRPDAVPWLFAPDEATCRKLVDVWGYVPAGQGHVRRSLDVTIPPFGVRVTECDG